MKPVVNLNRLNLKGTGRKTPINYKIKSEDEKLSRMRPIVRLDNNLFQKNTRKIMKQKYRIKSEDAKLSELKPVVRLKKLDLNGGNPSVFRPYPKLMRPRIKLKKIDMNLLKPVSINLEKLDNIEPHVAAKDKKLLTMTPTVNLQKIEALEKHHKNLRKKRRNKPY